MTPPAPNSRLQLLPWIAGLLVLFAAGLYLLVAARDPMVRLVGAAMLGMGVILSACVWLMGGRPRSAERPESPRCRVCGQDLRDLPPGGDCPRCGVKREDPEDRS